MYNGLKIKEAVMNAYERSGKAGMFVGAVQIYGSEPLKGNVTVGNRPVCDFYVEATGMKVYFRDSDTHVGYMAHYFHEDAPLSEIARVAKTWGITEDLEQIFTEFIKAVEEEVAC